MQTPERPHLAAPTLPTAALADAFRAVGDWVRFELVTVVGPNGWRSIAGPLAYLFAAVGLLLYDHANERMSDTVFWLALGLIVAVFARVLETNRKQLLALEEARDRDLNDPDTGLPNRRTLETDIALSAARPGERWMLVVLELDGLHAYGDRYGRQAAGELLRQSAGRLVATAERLHGRVYRFDDNRLAALLPAGEERLGEVILASTATLLPGEHEDAHIGRAFGEAQIPDEADGAEQAFQVAGQRLAAHKQRQQRSARRQAHAVLMAALSARRPELRNHLRVVAYRAISLARRLGLGREEIDDIALAAELQDIGLLTVPESILEKEGPLDPAELEMIHRHPVEGERIVAAAAGLEPVARLVRSSSERFDGSGYPDGVAGEAIPIGARIIAVAVAFAAMTSHRPYRPKLTTEEATAEMHRCAGSQFDPAVVAALEQDLAEERQAQAAASLQQTV